MSNDENTKLFERAEAMIDLFEGTLPAQLIEADIDRNDLEALRYHVTAAENAAIQQEVSNV